MTKPVIGVSAYAEQARWAVWELPAVLVPERYLNHVIAAGGLPVVLPPTEAIDTVLTRLDGLLLVGGGDIDPVRYGAEPHREIDRVAPHRDAAELAMIHAALEIGLPILGICRGLQLLNVARGGTLHQHVPDLVGHHGHAPTVGVPGRHTVRVQEKTLLARVLGRTELDIPSYHHQAIDKLGTGLVATAYADDGLVEAAEVADHPFAVGVQWHPECDDDLSLFKALVAMAAASVPVQRGRTRRIPVH